YIQRRRLNSRPSLAPFWSFISLRSTEDSHSSARQSPRSSAAPRHSEHGGGDNKPHQGGWRRGHCPRKRTGTRERQRIQLELHAEQEIPQEESGVAAVRAHAPESGLADALLHGRAPEAAAHGRAGAQLHLQGQQRRAVRTAGGRDGEAGGDRAHDGAEEDRHVLWRHLAVWRLVVCSELLLRPRSLRAEETALHPRPHLHGHDHV
ncbi:hypothetical protein B484DRAFT_23442, partial [Ochromonadaceae sp. CCMP2298]